MFCRRASFLFVGILGPIIHTLRIANSPASNCQLDPGSIWSAVAGAKSLVKDLELRIIRVSGWFNMPPTTTSVD
jgi:hypothetical protein